MAPPGRPVGSGGGGQSVPTSIAGSIARDIFERRYVPGGAVPGEFEGAERFKASRSSYREAVRALAAKGLVQSAPKLGTRVRPAADWQLFDSAVSRWMLGTAMGADLRGPMLELRATLDVESARLAARRCDQADIAAIATAVDGMEHSLPEPSPRARARGEVHRAVMNATGNALISSVGDSIAASVAAAPIEFEWCEGLGLYRLLQQRLAVGSELEAATIADRIVSFCR